MKKKSTDSLQCTHTCSETTDQLPEMVRGHNNGKELLTSRIVEHSFDIIHSFADKKGEAAYTNIECALSAFSSYKCSLILGLKVYWCTIRLYCAPDD